MPNTDCNSCDSCNSCDYCDSCDYCKNLKMTEYNYFCWSEKFNDDNSFQQKRYRIFNKEVSQGEYEKVKKIYHKLEFDKDENYKTRFQTAFKKMWDKLEDKEKQEYLDIPHFNWEGFTFITGITEEEKQEELTMEEVCAELGRTIKIKK